jgi:hypothetical protein
MVHSRPHSRGDAGLLRRPEHPLGYGIDPRDPSVLRVYRGDPSATATTASSSLVVFGNVPPGTVRITATPRALGGPAGTLVVVVRAGGLTEVAWVPTFRGS